MPIFDQGYQHWQGPLTAFHWRWLTVARHGIRAMLKSKIVRLGVLGAWMPALLLVVVLALWGLMEQQANSILQFVKDNHLLPDDVVAKPQDYRSAIWTIVYSFFFKAELAWMILLVLSVGPGLISRDLRFNALPLYLSRPIRRIDYFLGKLGVIGFFIAATTIAPTFIAYLCGIGFSLNLSVLKDTHRLLWASLAYGLIITVSAGTLMLALSSLSRRSIYVGIAWIGFCFLTFTISSILIGIQFHTRHDGAVRVEMDKWLADNPPPKGVEMHGIFPAGRHWQTSNDGTPNPEAEKISKWMQEWSTAYSEAHRVARDEHGNANADWRPLIGYTYNLGRIGDALLNVDQAWVTIGKTVERPRAAFAPALAIHSGRKLPHEITRSANERALAERFVWQFPWQWSAAVLAGLWVLSALVLSSRVKSLDRLK